MNQGLLDQIVATKHSEIEKLQSEGHPPPENRKSVPSFKLAVKRNQGENLKVIAECKKASPSKGIIRPDYDPLSIAGSYRQNGASAISVLTDRKYFQGNLEDLKKVVTLGLPVLRKDFILSELQIHEAIEAGSSAILLIVRLLSPQRLKELLQYARSLGQDVLVEVHSEIEAEIAMASGADIIGINHRNLDTLEMDLSLSERLAPRIRKEIPDSVIVAESGIESREGRERMEKFADALLIGHGLLVSGDIDEAWKKIFG